MGIQAGILPFLVLFLLNNTNITGTHAAAIFSLFPLGALLAGFFGGVLSDKLGRALVTVSALFGLSLTYFVAFALHRLLYGSDLFFVAFSGCIFLMGCLLATYWAAAQAQLAETTEPSKRQRAFRLRYVSLNLGGALGPSFFLVFDLVANDLTFLIAGGFFVVFGAYSAYFNARMLPKENSEARSRTEESKIKYIILDGSLRQALISIIFFLVGYSQLESNIAVIVKNTNGEDGTKLFAYLIILNAVSVFCFQPVSAYFEARMSSTAGILAGSLSLCGGYIVLLVFGATMPILVVYVLLLSLAELLFLPAATAFVASLAPSSMSGAYLGALSFRNIGAVVGPIAGSTALSVGGLSAFSATLVVTSILATIPFWKR